jgi:hypothetical protein
MLMAGWCHLSHQWNCFLGSVRFDSGGLVRGLEIGIVWNPSRWSECSAKFKSHRSPAFYLFHPAYSKHLLSWLSWYWSYFLQSYQELLPATFSGCFSVLILSFSVAVRRGQHSAVWTLPPLSVVTPQPYGVHAGQFYKPYVMSTSSAPGPEQAHHSDSGFCHSPFQSSASHTI